ncbi:MAG: response regulator [Candidatus Omnitrophica bacterium]|nr:response regulator [Candidatus Omnitrophota bacterium]
MSKKILIIDDEVDIQKLVALRLRKAGYEVEAVSSGYAAIEAIRSSRPDLILLDLRLPGTDGFNVCCQIKDDSVLKSIPVIIFTAVHPETIASRLRQCRAEDFILKPFQSQDLLAKVRRCLGESSPAEGK